MSPLVQGGEILVAVEASSQRAREIGIEAALAELGFDHEQMMIAADKEARNWILHLPSSPTVGEIVALLASGQMTALTAGIRLGRMYPAGNHRE